MYGRKASRDRERPGSQERDSAAMELFSEVCRNGGTMDLNIAVSALSRRNKETVKYFGEAKFIEKYASNILKVVQNTGQVEATMPLKFCPEAAKHCSLGGDCNKLHLCPYYLKGSCSYKAKCRRSHEVKDDHTMSLLMALNLEDIDDVVWAELLKRVVLDTEIERGAASHDIPDICKHYNNQGGCKKAEKCPFLHVCRHFVDGACKFGEGCKRDHRLTGDHHNKEIVKKFNLLNNSEQRLLALMRKRTTSASSDSSLQDGPVSPQPVKVTRPPPLNVQASADIGSQRDVEICGFHLKGSCSYGPIKCVNKHCDLPYQWQYQEVAPNASSPDWMDLTEDSNVMIENNFCDLSCTFKPFYIKGQSYEISFEDMAANPLMGQPKLKLRRVSTQSSEQAPPGHIFSTHWIWYWKDENGDWQSYDAPGSEVVANTTCSKSLEKDYVQGKESHAFGAGFHQYILCYKKMFQRNTRFLTEREVIRRPEFVTKDKMKEIEQRRRDALKDAAKAMSSSSISMSDTNLPSHWTAIEEKKDFCLVALSVTSQEYKNAEKKFQDTMSSQKTVIRIERIQNPDLWIAFAQKRARMQSKASNVPPEERALFHGTNADVRDAICQQGFDWRMCGKHGTLFGKGSYFACHANYSHRYTDHLVGGFCYMFIAKVLVGSYAEGSKSLTRPPPKNPTKPHGELFDSCANDVANPSIFVVFENNQCYPEYLITYR